MDEPLLSVRQLTVDFVTDSGNFRAVDGLNFDIPKGKTVAIVGESGSGKSITAQAIMQILPKQAKIGGGKILFNGPDFKNVVDIVSLEADSSAMRDMRGGCIAMIFQEPMTSLSPLHTIGDQISESYLTHIANDPAEAKKHTLEVLERVGFPDP